MVIVIVSTCQKIQRKLIFLLENSWDNKSLSSYYSIDEQNFEKNFLIRIGDGILVNKI